MKKLNVIRVTTALALALASNAEAQTLRAERIFQPAGGGAGAMVAPVEGAQKDVLLLLPTVPVTFNALQRDSTGEWRMGAAMTAGVGMTFLLGKATSNGESSTVDPWVIAGAAVNAGIREGDDRRIDEDLSVSGFFGFGDVAVNFSWPLLGGERSIGLALKLDVLTNLAPDAFMCLGGCK
jgi:hypothetical protein